MAIESRRVRLGISLGMVACFLLPGPGAQAADGGKSGFRTSRAAMLTPVMPGATVTPLLTVGDTLSSGYRYESIPDGISVRARGQGRVDLLINHETGKVPFPYVTASPTAANGENDFDNSQVSQVILNAKSAGVLNGSYLIDSSSGYQRFCSNYLATSAEGFDRDILFTNEETPDWVLRQEDSWPPPVSNAGAEESGVVVAVDVRTRKHHPIYGMGRHNHENSVPVPGFDDLVVLSGDDTFTSGPLTGVTLPPGVVVPGQSQLYSYIAPDTDSLLADDGTLYAFVSDTPGVRNYYDVVPGSGTNVTGHFIPVPKAIATGKNADGSEVRAADLGYPAPPSNGSWQTDLRVTAPNVGIDGPQWVMEYWSDINHVFQFVRIEDMAYDKRPGMGNVVYLADSGRGRTAAQSLDTPFRSTNGRVWKMVLDPNDPTKVTSMTVAVEGDDSPVKTLTEVHQPDNIETTQNGFFLTEDPGSSQQFPAGSSDPAATTARLWHVSYGGTAQVVAKVNQAADGGTTDVDGRLAGNWGAWETTGIVDASAAFGPGTYLINIQAHTLWIEKAPGDDNNLDGQPDFTYKREGGQLLMIRAPGL